MPLQIRRGTAAEKDAMIVPLANGELLWVTDDKKLYVGDGLTLPVSLAPASGFNAEDAKDAAATLFTQGGHVGITFSYDDAFNSEAGRITAELDLSNYQGVITADSFNGSVVADDSTTLVDGTNGSINLNGTIKSLVAPSSNGVVDIGTSSAKFKDIYATSLYLGTAQITNPSASIINLPAGSTIGGVEIGTVLSQDTSILRDLQGSVFGDDSTLLVNAIDNTIGTGTTLISNNVISTSFDSLEIENNYNPGNQLVARFNTIAAATTTSIADAGNLWKFVEIFAYKGSKASPGDIASGDVLGVLGIGGYQASTDSSINNVFGTQCDPNGTTTSTHIPTKFFWANQPAVEAGVAPLMTFDSFGRLAVNQEYAQATLDINGFAKLAILTAAPASPANGMVAIADGTSWNPLGAAGKQQMVVYLGNGWRAIAQEP